VHGHNAAAFGIELVDLAGFCGQTRQHALQGFFCFLTAAGDLLGLWVEGGPGDSVIGSHDGKPTGRYLMFASFFGQDHTITSPFLLGKTNYLHFQFLSPQILRICLEKGEFLLSTRFSYI